MTEKMDLSLERKKEQDWKQRRLRVEVRTQMHNAVCAFMYTVESHNLEVEKASEDYLISLLFDPDNLEKCERTIRTGKKSLKDPIRSSRKIGRKAVRLARAEKKRKVAQSHVEKAIEFQHGEGWPYANSKRCA